MRVTILGSYGSHNLQAVLCNHVMSNFGRDLIQSAVIGAALSVVLILVLNRPLSSHVSPSLNEAVDDGTKSSASVRTNDDITNGTGTPKEGVTAAADQLNAAGVSLASKVAANGTGSLDTTSNATLVPTINEQAALKKLKTLQKLLGISSNDMMNIIGDTNKEISTLNSTQTNNIHTNGEPGDKNEESFGLMTVLRWMDSIMLLVAVLLGCYAVDKMTHGSLFHFLSGMFSNEARSARELYYRLQSLFGGSISELVPAVDEQL